jgi:hypothetical protein
VIVLFEPTMTVTANDVVFVTPSTEICNPPGLLWNVSATVCGLSCRLALLVSPPESVAVNRSSRCAGYS